MGEPMYVRHLLYSLENSRHTANAYQCWQSRSLSGLQCGEDIILNSSFQRYRGKNASLSHRHCFCIIIPIQQSTQCDSLYCLALNFSFPSLKWLPSSLCPVLYPVNCVQTLWVCHNAVSTWALVCSSTHTILLWALSYHYSVPRALWRLSISHPSRLSLSVTTSGRSFLTTSSMPSLHNHHSFYCCKLFSS